MNEQVFADGVGSIAVIGGTVRLDFVVLSPTEKDPNGQPKAVFQQQVVMSVDGFVRSAGKIQEAVQAISKLGAARLQGDARDGEPANDGSAAPRAVPAAPAKPTKPPFP